MDDYNIDPQFDFSNLSALGLHKNKITNSEILSVFNNQNSCWYNLDGFPSSEYFLKIIGFSSGSRFLLLALNFQENKVIFHQIGIANENDIRFDYSGK